MEDRGFWNNLEVPVIGLSPMDGVTDAAFRYMVCKYSSPSLVMTEFTNVEGLARGAAKMMVAFLYNEIERPVVAQIYGVEVESFYKATVMLYALGYDGVDINMGCPANKVAKRGSGAGLIQTPELARKIIRRCKEAARDWHNGITMEEAGVHEEIVAKVEEMKKAMGLEEVRRDLLPVSVKTRIGFDCDVAVEWSKHLLEEMPANISMHGRTLKQMYLGLADWEAIGRVADVCKGSGVSVLGNGDVMTIEDAKKRTKDYGLDGVLVGRATMGAPWFFDGKEPETMDKRMEVLLDHCRYFVELDHIPFHNIKKHLSWYCKGFSGAKETRMKFMRSGSLAEVEEIVKNCYGS